MDRWELDEETTKAREIAKLAFDYEVTTYGIDDGMCRRPREPAYIRHPQYHVGYEEGLALPPQPALLE